MNDPNDAHPAANGPAMAALLSAAIGCFALGILTVFCEASESVYRFMQMYPATGALSGKVIVSILVWIGAWAVLSRRWRGRDIAVRGVTWMIGVLIVLGILGTFPPFFYLFG